MEFIEKYTCCLTGYRPNKLPWKYIEKGIRFLIFKFRLIKLIKVLIKKGYFCFISGMALGCDIIFAEIILKLKKKYKHIKLECALPCLNQTQKWNEIQKERYLKILKLADKVTYISKREYYSGCMQERNKYIVDKSSLVIAVYDGLCGGTQKTVEYAKQKNKEIKIIKP